MFCNQIDMVVSFMNCFLGTRKIYVQTVQNDLKKNHFLHHCDKVHFWTRASCAQTREHRRERMKMQSQNWTRKERRTKTKEKRYRSKKITSNIARNMYCRRNRLSWRVGRSVRKVFDSTVKLRPPPYSADLRSWVPKINTATRKRCC